MVSLLLDQIFSLLYKRDKRGHIVTYSSDSILIKEGHVPLIAYRLMEGEVEIYEGEKFIGKYGPHTCWGMNEIMNEKPSRYTVKIKMNSKVCTIGKSELQKTWMKFLHLFECDMLEKIKTPDLNG